MRRWLIFILCIASLGNAEERFVQNGSNQIACESFGNKENPALLLIMGAMEPGLAWTDELCHRFADKGFFVIRYDHRDIGWSTEVNDPYDLMDLTKDAVAILDGYGVEKAHVLGASMGGMIGILMSAHFSERVSSFTAMITSGNYNSMFEPEKYDIALRPKPEFLAWLNSTSQLKQATPGEKFDSYLACWRIIHGNKVPFPEEMYRTMVRAAMERMKYNVRGGGHHIDAMKASVKQVQDALPLVNVPTQIIQGSEDPIYPIPHGIALSESICGSKLIVVEGMGHVIQPAFFDQLVEAVCR